MQINDVRHITILLLTLKVNINALANRAFDLKKHINPQLPLFIFIGYYQCTFELKIVAPFPYSAVEFREVRKRILHENARADEIIDSCRQIADGIRRSTRDIFIHR